MALDLTVVIPAYNEEHRIGSALRDMDDHLRGAAYSSEIVIVDDGSRDGTREVVQFHAARLSHVRLVLSRANRGRGHALWLGSHAASGRLVAITDADLATPPEFLDPMVALLDAGHDMVVGSRVLPDAVIETPQPLYRQIMGIVYRRLAREVTGTPASDPQCGFKGFRRAALLGLLRRQTRLRFGFDTELLAMAEANGLEVCEMPVRWHHRTGSTVRPIVDPVRMLRDLWIIRRQIRSGHYRVGGDVLLEEPSGHGAVDHDR